jgi:NADPH2:quinone reductase
MRAAVVEAPGTIVVRDVADPTPGDEDAIIAVSLCGVCGTDLHVLDGDYPVVRYPVIPGHEFSGTVVALGRRARHLAIGDHVAVDPMLYCGSCTECRRGATNLCRRGGGIGTTADGALAEYIAVRASQCEIVPEGVPAAWAPITEPLSCVVHAMDRVGAVLGERTLVIGAGAAGLLMTGTLAAAGALVDVVELDPARRGLAPSFGARAVAGSLDELELSGEGWDLVVDASGHPAAIAAGLGHLRRGGRLLVFGVAPTAARVEFSPFDVFSRELTIIGTTSVRNSFRRAGELLATGTLPVELLVTEPLPLAASPLALERARTGFAVKSRVAPDARPETDGGSPR